ncbi:hypothetical protein C810_01606 [Lachnospiraceae bacterium A2]|nr:hypothetical protein C810_01606 [Lachnospiraceae bacterium A2]
MYQAAHYELVASRRISWWQKRPCSGGITILTSMCMGNIPVGFWPTANRSNSQMDVTEEDLAALKEGCPCFCKKIDEFPNFSCIF